MKSLLLRYLFLCCLCCFFQGGFAAGTVVSWQAPKGAGLNNDFTVKVRSEGKSKWVLVPTYLVKVDEVRETKHHVEHASMATFDFSEKVEIAVTYNKGKIDSARVRPLSYDIHRFEGGEFRIPSGKTVYVAGGSVMMGRMLIENVHDVKLLGRGIIDPSVKMGIRIANSRNVYVEGLMATQCATGGSDSVTIRNVKVISYFGWGDGMNVFSSRNVLFDRVFCRTSDDCTTVYGTRLGFEGPSSNITMQNSTLWADVAHPIFIGIHGNVDKPEILENLNYVNIDILDHKEKQLNYQGCLAINAGDENLIRNVRFEDIRIENFRQGQLVNLRIFFNEKYCKAPGRGIENVVFKNVSYTGNRAEISVIEGYDAQRKVRNIRFENLRINGQIISDDMPGKPKWYHTGDMARIYVGPHVEGVSFLNTFEK